MGPLLALLLAAAAIQSSDSTAWMTPESFHLKIGMTRAEAVAAVAAWKPKAGRNANELVIDYSGERAMTLEFRDERLRSIRFELFVLLPQIRGAFEKQREHLVATLGEPRKATRSLLIYDNILPNVMVVVIDDPASEQGKRGIGVLAVRYYDPRG